MITTKKDNLGNEMQYIRINQNDLSQKYKWIAKGTRAIIYSYENQFALKNFNNERLYLLNKRKELIKALMKVQDGSFCFPLGFLEYSNEELRGYYMEYLDKTYMTLELSVKEKTRLERIQILQKIDEAIERIHKKGIIIGDLHARNILVDKEGNPKFVDTDSYGFDNFLPEEKLFFVRTFQEEFGKEKSLIDCDKYWLGVLALEYLLPEVKVPNYPEELREFIKKCKFPKQVKEGFNIMFSDAINKPYVKTLLEKIDPEKELLKTRKRKKSYYV